jgi:5-methylcytosine-specific restriction enzyme B
MPKFESDQNKRTVRMLTSTEDLYDYFEIKGYSFSREILTRYFLSLKTKPFVILTGISGTGKTKIAQLFADYICQSEKPEEREKRIAFVPVRPDWMDNKGLLGYYNLFDEKYHATSVLLLLLEALKHPDKPYFIILDEMNLAKVEHYFSDFLSIMESRTPDKVQGELLNLHPFDNIATQDQAGIPAKILIPANVFFTGTVNIDESTYMFSPKVLDRANVIEFNEVDLIGYEKEIDGKDQFVLKEPDVRDSLVQPESNPFCSKQDYMKFLQMANSTDHPVSELLDLLKEYNLHFGYRVVNEMARFIWTSQEKIQHSNLNTAMDIQILQKILPKFHGTQAKLQEPLEKMIAFCYGSDVHFNEEYLHKAGQYDKEARFPRTAQKLARMIRNLKIQGYTSFIE